MQQEYGFTIPDEDAEQITTIGEAIDYVNRRLSEKETRRMAAHTDNSVVIDAPLRRVWERMNDVENWPNLSPSTRAARSSSASGDTIKFRLTTHPGPRVRRPGLELGLRADRRPGHATRSKSHRIETGPFEYMNIEWYFEPTDDGTKMRWVQDFSMKPSAPANDEQAEEYMNKNTKEQMEHDQGAARGSGAGLRLAAYTAGLAYAWTWNLTS